MICYVPYFNSRKTLARSKEYKYTVGESLKEETIELITLIYRANSRSDKTETLQTAREHIEVIRLLVRLMKDMHQIGLKPIVSVNEHVENVADFPSAI